MLKFENASAVQVTNFNADNSLGATTSPFIDGVKFTISDTAVRVANTKRKDGSAVMSPVLVTSIGDLFISMLVRSRVTADGDIVTPSGTLNVAVRDIIAANHGKTNGEILAAILAAVRGKTYIVKSDSYVGLTADGRKYPARLININEA